jgi:hypothetical protein
MTDPVLVLVVAAGALALLSLLLSRLIPDEYDQSNPHLAPARAKASRARR